MTRYQFPGKLFLMGEYFITKPNQEAIIAAINRFIVLEIKDSEKIILHSDYGSLKEDELQSPTKELRIAAEAIKTAYEYLDYLGIESRKLEIKVESDLLLKGKKIGLGSSGVIMLALISSILYEHELDVSDLERFKLASLCQKRLGLSGSGGDLAASVMGGLVHYQSYDFDWLRKQDASFDLIQKEWPGLSLKTIDMGKQLKLLVAWTQSENDTHQYLEVFNKKAEADIKTYQMFTKKASSYVKMFLEGYVFEAIQSYRLLMLDLQQWTGLNIETVDLKQSIEIANIHGASAKVSGSGGGDCMIALIENDHKKINLIHEEWEDICVHPLELEVWYHDAF